MANKKKVAISAMAATSMLLAGAAPALAANVDEAADSNQSVSADAVRTGEDLGAYAAADATAGRFAWDQSTVTPNIVIRDVFRVATSALCNATNDLAIDNPLQWKISVSGDVDNAFTATVDELAQEQAVQQTMTCSCGGNPSDGKAIITADVKGIPINYLAGRASAHNDANTITFISSDGTEASMPLAYAIGRHGVISFEINGEDLSASVGGNNQLWLAGASANYFVRDIVEIRITREDVVPANPGEGMEYPNSPNVGLLSASA